MPAAKDAFEEEEELPPCEEELCPCEEELCPCEEEELCSCEEEELCPCEEELPLCEEELPSCEEEDLCPCEEEELPSCEDEDGNKGTCSLGSAQLMTIIPEKTMTDRMVMIIFFIRGYGLLPQ